jgi:hypothetical protein
MVSLKGPSIMGAWLTIIVLVSVIGRHSPPDPSGSFEVNNKVIVPV